MPARARDLCTLVSLRSRRTVAHLDTRLTCMSPPSRTQIFSCWPGYSTPHYAHQHVQHARTPTYRAHPIPNCSRESARRTRPARCGHDHTSAGRMIPGSHKIAPRRRAHLALATLFTRHPICHQNMRSHRREDESHLPPFWPSPHRRRRHCRRRFEARGPPPPSSRRLVARSFCCRHATRFASSQAGTRRVGRIGRFASPAPQAGTRRFGRIGWTPRRVGRLRRRLSRRSGRLRRSRRAALGSSR